MIQIGEDRLRNADLHRQVDGFKASIAERRTQMGGVNAAQETELHVRAPGWLGTSSPAVHVPTFSCPALPKGKAGSGSK